MYVVAGDPGVANHLLLPAPLLLLLVSYVPGMSAVAGDPCVANHLLLPAFMLLLHVLMFLVCLLLLATPVLLTTCYCQRSCC
jgi:hypothetical protein